MRTSGCRTARVTSSMSGRELLMRILSLAIAVLALLVLAFPAFAKPDNPGGNGRGHGGNPHGAESSSNRCGDNDDNGDCGGKFAASSDVDCADGARNHGQYVSCVAHGGNPESGPSVADADGDHGSVVSDAAHSDIGKDNEGSDFSAAGDNNGDNGDN